MNVFCLWGGASHKRHLVLYPYRGGFQCRSMFVMHVVISTILKLVIRMVESHLERLSKIFRMIGYVRNAVLERMNSLRQTKFIQRRERMLSPFTV